MIEIPDLALAGLAAGTLLAFVLWGVLLRSRRHRSAQREEIAGVKAELTVARREFDETRNELARTRRESDELRREAGRSAEALTAEIAHLAERRIPAEARRAAHPHVPVPGPLNDELAAGPLGDSLDAVLSGVLTAVTQERKRVDAAARAGMRGATRDIQAGLYRLQDVLRGLQQRYDEPELAQILFSLDHENEQSLRRAQVTAVVCDAWVGLAREESHLVEAVTGGQSRLVGYHRVEISNHLEPGTALVSHAVEPVAIIVAELLDNALRYSASDTPVVVNLERVHHGVSITVDDAGVGMAANERAYAQRMVAGDDPILLSELGDPPRMGLAAVGQLTRRFDLSVDLSSPSPYGGVRAVLLVRSHLLSRIDPEVRPPAASTPRSTRRDAGQVPAAAAAPAAPSHSRAASPPPAAGRPDPAARPDRAEIRDDRADRADSDAAHAHGHEAAPYPDELPQRRRRARPRPAETGASTAQPLPPARTPEEAAAALGALQSGTAAARQAAESEGNDQR